MVEMTDRRRQRIKDVEGATLAKGKAEYLKWLKGKHISRKEAMDANCYVCMGYYSDGRGPCSVELCPCRDYMVYNPERIKRYVSEEQKKASVERFASVRISRGVKPPASGRKKK